MDQFCYLCLVFVILSRLFIAALWPPAGKRLSSWLLCVMSVILSLFHVVSWIRCGTWSYIFLIVAVFLTFTLSIWLSYIVHNEVLLLFLLLFLHRWIMLNYL